MMNNLEKYVNFNKSKITIKINKPCDNYLAKLFDFVKDQNAVDQKLQICS